MSGYWQPDDYAQAEADYEGAKSVNGGVNTPRKGGKCGKTANTRKCRKWRASHRAHRRDYMRRYMAARRATAIP